MSRDELGKQPLQAQWVPRLTSQGLMAEDDGENRRDPRADDEPDKPQETLVDTCQAMINQPEALLDQSESRFDEAFKRVEPAIDPIEPVCDLDERTFDVAQSGFHGLRIHAPALYFPWFMDRTSRTPAVAASSGCHLRTQRVQMLAPRTARIL